MTDPVENFTVYYDGECPLCSSEIDWYRRQAGAQRVNWLDVRTIDEAALGSNLTAEKALKRFYVRDGEGQLTSGARAFAKLWKRLPRLRKLGTIAEYQGVALFMELSYRLFLLLRPMLQRLMRLLRVIRPTGGRKH